MGCNRRNAAQPLPLSGRLIPVHEASLRLEQQCKRWQSSPYHARMSFIAILVALLLEQARPVARGNPIHGFLRSWVRWSARSFDAGRPQQAAVAWAVATLLPSTVVFVIHWLLIHFAGWLFAVVWSVGVLYVTLGFRQFSHHFTGIRNALDDGDEERARRLLAEWRQLDVAELPSADIAGQVIGYSVIAAHRHVFGVIAWFSILAACGLGPAGAVFYRLCEFVPRYWSHKSLVALQPVSIAARDTAQQAWRWVDWLPARLTAVGFAVVGSFEEAIESWRNYEQRGADSNDGVILSATAGALNLRIGPLWDGSAQSVDQPSDPSGDPQPPTQGNSAALPAQVGHLRTVVGLVWRTVLMWMILLFLLSLARLLG